MRLRHQFVLVTIAKFFVAGLNVLFVYLCMSRLDRGEAAAFFAQYSAIMLLSAFCGLGLWDWAVSLPQDFCTRSRSRSLYSNRSTPAERASSWSALP
jgi:hypothetical protein